ncbi:glycosyltransferase family 4 protein, partial [Psychrobacter phenylpyruvicus]
MRIVFIVPRLVNCGPVNVVLNLVNELSNRPGIDISIVSIRSNDIQYSTEFLSLGITKLYTLANTRGFLKKILYLSNLVKDADIIHSHGFYPDLLSACFLRKCKRRISTAHSLFIKDYRSVYGNIKGLCYGLLHHTVYWISSFDKIVGCSESVKDYLIESSSLFIRKGNITFVHNGVNTDRYFKLSQHDKHKLLMELNLPVNLNDSYESETKVFIYSGRITRSKKTFEMIRWFIGSQYIDNSILLILGEGEEMVKCTELAQDYKK